MVIIRHTSLLTGPKATTPNTQLSPRTWTCSRSTRSSTPPAATGFSSSLCVKFIKQIGPRLARVARPQKEHAHKTDLQMFLLYPVPPVLSCSDIYGPPSKLPRPSTCHPRPDWLFAGGLATGALSRMVGSWQGRAK